MNHAARRLHALFLFDLLEARAALVLVALVSIFAGCGQRRERQTAVDGAAPAAAASAPWPDVVSSASPGEVESMAEAGAPAIAEGDVVDGAQLRAAHRARIQADTSPVVLLEGGTPRELGERLCARVVPKRPPETKVLLKPNLGGFEWFKDPATHDGDDGVRGRTTDPEFVRGIVRCLKARGHTKITIAEGWDGTNANWNKLARVSGYARMAEEERVPLVALDDDGVFDRQGDRPAEPLRISGMEQTRVPTLLVPRLVAQHLRGGLFISAPKVKAHRFGVVSLAIKGMQGTVMTSDGAPAMHQKKQMHREISAALKLLASDRAEGQKAYVASLEVFAERMVDVLEVEAPDVVLAEGAPAMGGDGFGKRWPSAESVAIGGTNPILVDRVGAQLLGLWDNAALASKLGGHRTSPLITAAARRFAVDLDAVKIEGDGAALLAGGKRRPVHFVSMSGFELHDAAPPEADTADAGADAAAGPSAGDALAPRVARATRVKGDVAAALAAAAPVTFTTDWSGADAGIRTEARFAWANGALHVRWRLEGAGLNVDTTRPVETERRKLYEEDCVELFVGADASDLDRYFEIEVGPRGHFFDLEIDRRKKLSVEQQIAWSSKPTIVTKVDEAARTVQVDLTVRAPEITTALKPGATLLLALYRMEGKAPRRYLAWSPTRTPKPNFHVPSAFGRLLLDP